MLGACLTRPAVGTAMHVCLPLSRLPSAQVAELGAVVAAAKADYDSHKARLDERLDRLKVRHAALCMLWRVL